jgi:hypothetical protein
MLFFLFAQDSLSSAACLKSLYNRNMERIEEEGDIGQGVARRLEWNRSSVKSSSAMRLRKLLKSNEDILNDRDRLGEIGERQGATSR